MPTLGAGDSFDRGIALSGRRQPQRPTCVHRVQRHLGRGDLDACRFFLSATGRDLKQPNRFIILLYLGIASLSLGVLSLGIGLLTS
jgi:hypothetical protein